MLHDLLMPKLGLTMTEGLVSEWKVKPGQAFAHGEILLIVETEKIAYEIEAEAPGVVAEILVPQGGVVPVGSVIARWQDSAGAHQAPAKSAAAEGTLPGGDPGVRLSSAAPSVAAPSPPSSRPAGPRPRSTPLARRLARQHGVDLRGVCGSGPSGRITMADVASAVGAEPQAPRAGSEKEEPTPSIDRGTGTPPDPIQATMARRLTAVKQEVPHFYLAAEAEVMALLALRKTLNADPGCPRITINHMIVAAVGRALLDLPHANRVWRAGQLLAFADTDVGIAVHTPRGLFVPILRDAGRANLETVAKESAKLVEKARKARLAADDMVGGAVAVSNAGMFDVTYMTPIINPGHSAILGVGSVRQTFRPDAAGQPVLRREIGLVLACDHRVFDGVAGLELLNRVIAWLENPVRLLRNQGATR